MNYEKIVRQLRQRIFDYTGEQEKKADRVLSKAIKHKVKQYPPKPVGIYSGLSKSELRRSGTCETDWF